MAFNHLKLKILFTEAHKFMSYRKMDENFNIDRNLIAKWTDEEKSKNGPNDESWDRITYMFACLGIFVRKDDFYGEELETQYNLEEIESYLADKGFDNSNYSKDPFIIETIKKLRLMEDLFRDKCKGILKLRADKDKIIDEQKDIIDKQNITLKEKDSLIEELKQAIEVYKETINKGNQTK